MTRLLVLMFASLVLLAGCKSVPGEDGRYATPPRGGWDNFRG